MEVMLPIILTFPVEKVVFLKEENSKLSADIQKAKDKLIAQAKAKGITENFGQADVKKLEETDPVSASRRPDGQAERGRCLALSFARIYMD